MLALAIALISSALVAYTAGVWAEHRSGTLKPWHAIAFGTGLVFDATGTWIMSRIADSPEGAEFATSALASNLNAVMAVTGGLALVLMAVHLVWAGLVLYRNRSSELAVFHRFSLAVWTLWLLPYFTGMAAAMLS